MARGAASGVWVGSATAVLGRPLSFCRSAVPGRVSRSDTAPARQERAKRVLPGAARTLGRGSSAHSRTGSCLAGSRPIQTASAACRRGGHDLGANSLGGAPATRPKCIGCKVLPACHHPDGRCVAGRVRVSISARLWAGTDGNHPAAREDSEAASGPRRFPSSSAVHVGHDSTGGGVLPIRVRQARVGRHLAAGCPLSLVHGGVPKRCAPVFLRGASVYFHELVCARMTPTSRSVRRRDIKQNPLRALSTLSP